MNLFILSAFLFNESSLLIFSLASYKVFYFRGNLELSNMLMFYTDELSAINYSMFGKSVINDEFTNYDVFL